MTNKVCPADDGVLSEVIGFVEENLDIYGCGMKAIMQITVSVEEIFVNIAHYAYGEGQGDVLVSMENEDGNVTVTFEDSGKEFNPLKKADPDITLSAEERSIGGLGIFMVKKSMDDVQYERRDGKNIFSMSKRTG